VRSKSNSYLKQEAKFNTQPDGEPGSDTRYNPSRQFYSVRDPESQEIPHRAIFDSKTRAHETRRPVDMDEASRRLRVDQNTILHVC
jgi:hypothetical protein